VIGVGEVQDVTEDGEDEKMLRVDVFAVELNSKSKRQVTTFLFGGGFEPDGEILGFGASPSDPGLEAPFRWYGPPGAALEAGPGS
jgi:hypothetical protein